MYSNSRTKRFFWLVLIELFIVIQGWAQGKPNSVSVNAGQVLSGILLWSTRDINVPLEYRRAINDSTSVSLVLTPHYTNYFDVTASLGLRFYPYIIRTGDPEGRTAAGLYWGIYPFYNEGLGYNANGGFNWNIMSEFGLTLFSSKSFFLDLSIGIAISQFQNIFFSQTALPSFALGLSPGVKF